MRPSLSVSTGAGMCNLRQVIINADDLGPSQEVNEGIFKGIEQGVITDASLLARSRCARDAARVLQGLKRTAIGIHIDLDRQLGWTSPGNERYPRAELLNRLQSREFQDGLYAEAKQQIELFLDFGLVPSHIDTHHHVHGFMPIFQVILRLLSEYGIRAVRFSRSGYKLPTREDIPFDHRTYHAMEAKLKEGGVRYCDGMLEGAERIGDVQDGITELVVHPGLGGDRWREKELETLLSPEFRFRLEERGIALISFYDLFDPLRS